jgi:hypothetical protein
MANDQVFDSAASAIDEYLYSNCPACRAGRAYAGLGAIAGLIVAGSLVLFVYSAGYAAVAVLGVAVGWWLRQHAFGLSRAIKRKRRRDERAADNKLADFLKSRGGRTWEPHPSPPASAVIQDTAMVEAPNVPVRIHALLPYSTSPYPAGTRVAVNKRAISAEAQNRGYVLKPGEIVGDAFVIYYVVCDIDTGTDNPDQVPVSVPVCLNPFYSQNTF